MKKLTLSLSVFFAAAMIFISCTKNNAVKPANITNVTADNSFIIATDVAGTAIWSGTDNPPTTVGNVGDFYINTTLHYLWGPKTASGWGTATHLVGAAGSAILSGTGVPAATLGKVGDYYINTSNMNFYGPKTSSGWGTAVALRGTANVTYSDWITPSTYKKDTIFGIFHFDANITASKITQTILDKGSVLVYGKLDGYNPAIWPTDQVSPLPILITYMDGTSPNTDTWSDNVTLGNIQIDLTSSLNAYGSISNAHQFRYIIIPGGVHTLGAVNPKNYSEVQKALHITD
jgi:hypothetical protein